MCQHGPGALEYSSTLVTPRKQYIEHVFEYSNTYFRYEPCSGADRDFVRHVSCTCVQSIHALREPAEELERINYNMTLKFTHGNAHPTLKLLAPAQVINNFNRNMTFSVRSHKSRCNNHFAPQCSMEIYFRINWSKPTKTQF